LTVLVGAVGLAVVAVLVVVYLMTRGPDDGER
jgi:hypothetical protein